MSDAETKSCQSCHGQFTIAPEDFAFYEKMQVPPPTWCPDCRTARRLAFRNEWHVFQKPDDRTGETVFSSFSPASPVKVYETSYWNSDAWDALEYGRDYDFSRPFFEQFRDLLHTVPVQSRVVRDIENSDYCVNVTGVKNCYLVSSASFTEDSAYVVSDSYSRNCFDCRISGSSELCYGSVNVFNCYQTHHSVNCEGCRGVMLSKDLVGCQDCFGCVNLRNKQYYIFNEPHTKEEYAAKIQSFNLGSRRSFSELAKRARTFWLQHPERFMQGSSNELVSGNYIYESKNAQSCWRVKTVEDSKYCQGVIVGPVRDSYDYTNWGFNVERVYESMQCGDSINNVKFSIGCWRNSSDLQYSAYCFGNNRNLFGCVSLHNKQYCILNKQYTKEEYEALVPKIIEHMNQMPYVDAQGREYRYGEFFPAEISPIEYNVSLAQEFFPIDRTTAQAQGLSWYEKPEQPLDIDLPAEQLPDSITDATESLATLVVGCAHSAECNEECTRGFRIIPQELAFLIEHGLPLPEFCPNCRQYQRIQDLTGLRPYHRQCDCRGERAAQGVYTNLSVDHASHSQTEPCPNMFETNFAPDGPQFVYCETCYQAEAS